MLRQELITEVSGKILVWDYRTTGFVDYNCRIIAFNLYKDFIKSEGKVENADTNLMFDIDAMNNNPLSKFKPEEVDKFINIYSPIPVKNTQDLASQILKEWDKRGIKFENPSNVSLISGFLHYPEDNIVFIGHTGVLIEDKDGFIFIEKYAPGLPYQVSKFNSEDEVRDYVMNRLDINESDNGAAKPTIMKNNELMK